MVLATTSPAIRPMTVRGTRMSAHVAMRAPPLSGKRARWYVTAAAHPIDTRYTIRGGATVMAANCPRPAGSSTLARMAPLSAFRRSTSAVVSVVIAELRLPPGRRKVAPVRARRPLNRLVLATVPTRSVPLAAAIRRWLPSPEGGRDGLAIRVSPRNTPRPVRHQRRQPMVAARVGHGHRNGDRPGEGVDLLLPHQGIVLRADADVGEG